MKLKSITTRMVLTIIFLVAAMTITFSQIFLYQAQQALLNDFHRHGKSVAENLALNAELGLLLEDRGSLRSLGRNLLREEAVSMVRILNSKGETVVEVGKNNSPDRQGQVFAAAVQLSQSEDDLSIYLPERPSGKNLKLGQVEVTFSQAQLSNIIREVKGRIYTFAFLGLLIGGILAYYLSWGTLRPINRLAQASKAISEGHWEMRVEESGQDEIGQLTRDFNRMAASLEDKRRALEESYRELARKERMAEIGKFSTMIAHEIKNPLGIIRGSINILGKKEVSEKIRETMVAYINEEVTRLNQLTEDFLAFARPAPPKKETVDLRELMEKIEAIASLRNKEEKAVSVKIGLEPGASFVPADKNQLFQALLNLVQNAIHAAPEGIGEVTIFAREENQGIVIEIADNGAGVKPEDRNRIFEPFFTRKEKGTGLGLTIVRKIVEMHDGEVRLVEGKTDGACFAIWLPKGDAAVEGGSRIASASEWKQRSDREGGYDG